MSAYLESGPVLQVLRPVLRQFVVEAGAIICQRSPPQLSSKPVCLPLYIQILSWNTTVVAVARGAQGAWSVWRCQLRPSREYHTSLRASVERSGLAEDLPALVARSTAQLFDLGARTFETRSLLKTAGVALA